MSPFVVRAPGKLVLVGEYAVLDGAPALVAAVDRGVRCVVQPGDALITPADDRFVAAALRAVDAPPRRYQFEDWNPPKLPGKAGFGGSAAATVAACAAGLTAAGRSLEPLASTARAVHRAVQGGGSGIDVLASVHGGLRALHADGTVGPDAPLHARLTTVWSGRSASTGPRVQRYCAWQGRAEFVRQSAALLPFFRDDPIRTLREAYALLRAMADAANLDYDTPAFACIAALADRFGGAAKPSGAGGGDIAVALLPDDEALAAFCAACAAENLPPVPVQISGGVTCTELRNA